MDSADLLNPFDLRIRLPKMKFADDARLVGLNLFNPNEYDSSLEKRAEACANRYGMIVVYAGNTIKEIAALRSCGFADDLSLINKSIPLRRNFFVELNCPSVLSNFETLLIVTKSLLDVLCLLLAHRIQQPIDGFHKYRNVVGGRVLNALSKSTSLSRLPDRDRLVFLLEQHKREWIDDLVRMRDEIVHDGQLSDFVGFWMVLEGDRTHAYSMDDVHNPVLRNGEKIESYCEKLPVSVKEFAVSFRDYVFTPEERAAVLAMR